MRIGAGSTTTGALGEDGMARASAAIEVFAHFCEAAGLAADEVDVVATSAIREATNPEEFLERAREASGLAIRVLSREEEARYGYLAAVNSTTSSTAPCSTSAAARCSSCACATASRGELDSWRLGAVRMTERFLPGDGPASGKQLRACASTSRASSSAPTGSTRRPSGSSASAARCATSPRRCSARCETPEFGVQGFVIERDALDDLVDRLAALPAAERRRGPRHQARARRHHARRRGRRAAVLESGGFAGIEATEAGLREGVFFDRALAGRDEPLFDDVRRASVLNLAAQYDPHARAHPARRRPRADALRRARRRRAARRATPAERELLWAACMLHDIGVAVDYDDHHKHSRYLILNAGCRGSPRARSR